MKSACWNVTVKPVKDVFCVGSYQEPCHVKRKGYRLIGKFLVAARLLMDMHSLLCFQACSLCLVSSDAALYDIFEGFATHMPWTSEVKATS